MQVDTTRPLDLGAAVALALATVAVALADPWGPLRVALGLPFVFFLPGYALAAALFPERYRAYEVAKGEDRQRTEEVEEGLDALERVVLSLGLSIAVVPLAGLVLNYTPWGIRPVPILASLGAFVVACAGLAHRRRSRLPEDERFRVRFAVRLPGWEAESTLDRALNVAVAVSIAFAAGSLAYVLASPRPGEAFTEFYTLGPEGRAADYPTNLSTGEEGRLILGIANREHETVRYEAEMIAQRGSLASDGNGTFRPETNRTLETWTPRLEPDETWEANVSFSLGDPGRYRLVFHLDKPGASQTPYRSLHLWVNVTG